MNCAWDKLLILLPQRMRQEIDRLGRDTLEEVRLRWDKPVELIFKGKMMLLTHMATMDDVKFVINTASRYSPWTAATISQGYLTASGGHRIGICGECVIQNGIVTGIKTVHSLCIRVARGFPGIGLKAPLEGSLLILGPPGSGKTTLLRDMIRIRSERGQAMSVVDERGELFPVGADFSSGPRTDVLTGCNKAQGVTMTIKTMRPDCVAVDEITSEEDCQALMNAGWCGVELLATAHARDVDDLHRRQIYQPLIRLGLFTHALILKKDKTYLVERIDSCISRSSVRL